MKRLSLFFGFGFLLTSFSWVTAQEHNSALPQLRIVSLDRATITITWTNTLQQFQLEWTEAVDGTFAWQPVFESPVLSNNQYSVTLAAAGASGAFRLRLITPMSETAALARDDSVTNDPFTAKRGTPLVLSGSEGTPDDTDIMLTLSTELDSKPVIQKDTTVKLSLTVPGTSQMTVTLSQFLEPNGASEIFFGDVGTDASTSVMTSGGTPNTATVTLRHATTGAFQNDFSIKASVDGVERGRKFATAIELNGTPACIYIADQRPVSQTVTVTPALEGLRLAIESSTVESVTGSGHVSKYLHPALSATKTDANGKADVQWKPLGIERYVVAKIVANGATGSPLVDGNEVCPITGKKGPCPHSVDPSDGEKKLTLTDLVIKGRGMDYSFSRTYRSHNYRRALASNGAPVVNDFGENWIFSYADEYLIKDGAGPDDSSNFINCRDDWSDFVFVNIGPGKWFAGPERFEEFRINPRTGDFEIRDSSGTLRIYHNFSETTNPNRNGRLKAIRDRNENLLSFLYDKIIVHEGFEKFVLTRVIDTMGREIRSQYFAATAQKAGNDRTLTIATGNPGAQGRLARVIDFKSDIGNRKLVFGYDLEGNLVRCSHPAVLGTPNNNDFREGKTYRYKYISEANPSSNWNSLTSEQKDFLRHRLTHIWYPNQVKNTAGTDPADSAARETVTYETDPQNRFFGYALTYRVGGVNESGVPAGGIYSYAWTDLNPNRSMPAGSLFDARLLYNTQNLEVKITDRNGNVEVLTYGGGKTLLSRRELTRGFRSGEPVSFDTFNSPNRDRLLAKDVSPEGNQTTYIYNQNSSDRFEQGNLIRSIRTPDPARGEQSDQSKIETVALYEPIYNRPCLIISARGADVGHNDFTSPIADPAKEVRQVSDPFDAIKTVDLRYARVEFFDFQESAEKALEAPNTRLNKDGSNGRVNQSPVIGVEPNVLTVEIWLLQQLGLSENVAGLAELRQRLQSNLTTLGLGDLNGDGDTTPTIAGNIIRTVWGSPVLLPGSNQRFLENAIETLGDLIDETKGYRAGGTQEGTFGQQLQTIAVMRQYNSFGQLTKIISPEGNVTTHEYYAETDPNGDIRKTVSPADGRTLDAMTGGYLKKTVADTTRSYTQQSTGATLNGGFSNNDTGSEETDITTQYTYDDVGNVVRMTNGRGIRTDYFVNELDQVVQTVKAADISGAGLANPSDPLLNHANLNEALTAFAYKTRTFYDFNNNVIQEQVEDAENTSDTGGFVDTFYKYDILDNRIEVSQEMEIGKSLITRYRYDGNQNRVLTLHPEGNADSAIFDERNLLLQSTRGASSRPTAGLFAADDPTTFNRPGGTGTVPSTTTYNYDRNGNLIETVDAFSHGGTSSIIAGAGDATRYTYDGYDRKRTMTDALGNRMTYFYDPDNNLVRTISDGDPIDDVVGSSENKTLAVTEYIHDELKRIIATHRVLFQTPDAAPMRTPTLTDTPAMDGLAPYLFDAPSDTAVVPGATGITVIGRVTTLTEYDRESRVTFTVQDDLDVYRTDYDGADRVVKTTDSALSNGFDGVIFDPDSLSGNAIETAYDDNNNIIERKETEVTTLTSVSPEIFRTTYLYDALDRLQTMFDNLGQAADYRYDSRNNQVAKADAVGPVSSRSFNRRGLGPTVAVSINDFGNVTRSIYDGVNRLLETQSFLTASGQGNGTYISATLRGKRVNPPVGYLDSTQSGDGRISVYYAYDDNSQLIALRDDNGNTTAYVYDNQNRMVVERKGLTFTGTTFSIAGGDSGSFRVVLRGGVPPVDTEPAGTDIVYSYDPDSNVTLITDEAGNVRDCAYDALNRRKSCSITRAPGFIGTTRKTWQYDGRSRLTESSDNNEPGAPEDDVTEQFFYDSLSRKVEEQQQIGSLSAKAYSCNYEIDCACGGSAVGLPSKCKYPDGRIILNLYDRLDRLISRNDEGFSNIGTYQYIGKSRIATLTYQNGTRLTHIGQVVGTNTDIGFDGLRRIVNHRWEKFTPVPPGQSTPFGNGTVIVGFGHQDGGGRPAYDRANNKLIEEKLHDPGNSEVYNYDSTYRLRAFDRGTMNVEKTAIMTATTTANALQAQRWSIDGPGNWIANTHTTGGIARTETRTHSDFNEIVAVTGTPYAGGVPGNHTLDKNGNLTNDGTRTYLWDALNRLRRVVRKADGQQIGEYSYDAQNRRTRKIISNGGLDGTVANGLTDFYYDGWRVVEEHDDNDMIIQQYTYGNYLDEIWTLDSRRGGNTISKINDGTSGERHFYHGNTQYSVYALSDETGALQEGYQYDAYGRRTVFGPGANAIVDFGGDDQVDEGPSALGQPHGFMGQRFESESALAYCKRRYYSPELGRWLSRDPIGEHRSSVNLYSFVGNNPANKKDQLGLQSEYLMQQEYMRQQREMYGDNPPPPRPPNNTPDVEPVIPIEEPTPPQPSRICEYRCVFSSQDDKNCYYGGCTLTSGPSSCPLPPADVPEETPVYCTHCPPFIEVIDEYY